MIETTGRLLPRNKYLKAIPFLTQFGPQIAKGQSIPDASTSGKIGSVSTVAKKNVKKLHQDLLNCSNMDLHMTVVDNLINHLITHKSVGLYACLAEITHHSQPAHKYF